VSSKPNSFDRWQDISVDGLRSAHAKACATVAAVRRKHLAQPETWRDTHDACLAARDGIKDALDRREQEGRTRCA